MFFRFVFVYELPQSTRRMTKKVKCGNDKKVKPGNDRENKPINDTVISKHPSLDNLPFDRIYFQLYFFTENPK